MYADQVTDSMRRAISETQRRRQLQLGYNEEHGIDPQTIRKAVTDILVDAAAGRDGARRRARTSARASTTGCAATWPSCRATRCAGSSSPSRRRCTRRRTELRFEYAARLRDEIKDLKRELRDVG